MSSYEKRLQIKRYMNYSMSFADYENREMQKYCLAIAEKYIAFLFHGF